MALDVRLSRDVDEPWGFAIYGGVDDDMPLTIEKIEPDSPAKRAGLLNGDTILTLNGEEAIDMSVQTASRRVEECGHSITVGVLRLTLNDIVTLLEEDEIENNTTENDIYLLPPENATGELTDEDSGDEDNVEINNLPSSLLRSNAELHRANAEDFESHQSSLGGEEPELCEPLRKISKKYNWRKQNYTKGNPSWKPMFHVPEQRSPIEWFSLFFSEDLYLLLTTETNKYLGRKNLPADIKMEEMKCAIGILLVSGYCQVNRRRMYWENTPDTRNELIVSALSRDRFSAIFSNLHCADNLQLDNSDKFAKVRPLMNKISSAFQAYCPHKENHSVDEAMVPYFGRHGCKQFIRGKPIRYGFKLWVGATSGGYIVWFEPYQGASTKLNPRYAELGLGASVVLSYTDKLSQLGLGGNYHLFIDNFFSGLPLIAELTKRNIRVTGTIRENRTGNCPLLDNKEAKKKERGFFDYRVSDELIICKWHDNSIVTVCSNALDITPLHKTERYSQKEKKKITVSQPHLIHQYNQNMGGVDLSDQNISTLRTSIRGKKWYMPLILHCIDMSLQNAWLLCKYNGGSVDMLTFRRRVAIALIESNTLRSKPGPSRPSSLTMDTRFDEKGHYVIKQPQNKRTRCGLCHRLCPARCVKCNIGLHVECFVTYHTKK